MSTPARDVEKKLKRAAEVAEALVQARNAQNEIDEERERRENYVGKHRAY
jgi:hypothetical protein